MVINELKEHADDEIVDFNEIDLQHEYDKLNKLLFNGELKPVKMIWNSRKSAHGLVSAQRNRATGQIEIKHLAMSQFLNVTYKNFKDVLAHEMIHVKLLQNNINDGHGWRFKTEMAKINNMGLGFNITITAHFEEAEINKKFTTKMPMMIVTIIDNNKHSNMINVMKPELFEKVRLNLERMFQGLVFRRKYRFVKLTYIKSNDPELQKFPSKKQATASISYSAATEDFINKLKSEGEIIGSIEIKP